MDDVLATRAATAPDAPAINALVNSAYRGESSRAGWTTEADLLGGQRVDVERIEEIIATPGSVILIHERDGAPIACVLLERTSDTQCYLGMLTVKPALQGDGIGRRMLDAAERWAIEAWESRVMHMTVITLRTELIAWYERCGYRRTGKRQPFPYGDERFGRPKRPDLVFEVLTKALDGQD